MEPQTLTSAAGAMPPRIANLPIRDPAARLYLLTRLILSFDESDQQLLIELVTCGFTPELIDKLRHMSMVDALRFTANHCGLSLGVDAQVVRHQVERLERTRADRQMYEYFIHAGASPSLISRLFAVAPDDVRRLRKLIAPTVVPGGRPRHPSDELRVQIEAAWHRIGQSEPRERQALYLLHQEFRSVSMSTLEVAVRPPTSTPSAAWFAANRPWTSAAQVVQSAA